MTHSDDSQDAAASGQHAVMSQALSLTQVLECCLCCKLSCDTRVCVCPASQLSPCTSICVPAPVPQGNEIGQQQSQNIQDG